MNSRIATLKAMDTIMRNAEDEQVTMAWLTGGVPDDADDEDYESIAAEDDVYYDICECFSRLVSAYSHLVFGTKPPKKGLLEYIRDKDIKEVM